MTPLPEGTRLLHIGPAKTGTTALQSGFHHNREALVPHGVHYAGRGSQVRAAAGAVATGRRIAGHVQGVEAWPRLVKEVRDSTAKRVVISSETFARADDAGAAKAIEGLGADRTHVVITMRPLADMLPSSWQQHVQLGSRQPYGDWLEETLRATDPQRDPQPAFWRKSRIDVLARRWGALVGPEHVTVVSLAAAPRDFVLRTFERLTALPAGTLVPGPASDNVSLGFGTTEVLRHFNRLFFAQPGASADVQAAVVEFGAVRHLRQRPDALRADPRIELPRWAAERASTIAAEMNLGLVRAGVNVVGDLDALTRPSRPPVAVLEEPDGVDTEAAAQLLLGMMLTAGKGMPDFSRIEHAAPVAGIDDMRTTELLGHAVRRVARRVRSRLSGH